MSKLCTTHGTAHRQFSDGSTICPECLEAIVERKMAHAIDILRSLLSILPPYEKERLQHAVDLVYLVTGDEGDVAVLKLIACEALRTNSSVDEVLAKIRETRSVVNLLFL